MSNASRDRAEPGPGRPAVNAEAPVRQSSDLRSIELWSHARTRAKRCAASSALPVAGSTGVSSSAYLKTRFQFGVDDSGGRGAKRSRVGTI